MGLQEAREILVEMMEDLGRVAGKEMRSTGWKACATEEARPTGTGVAEVMATIASPLIALALLLLIMVMVLGRGLGRHGSTGETPVPLEEKYFE